VGKWADDKRKRGYLTANVIIGNHEKERNYVSIKLNQ
jgi:hypothetical protein